MHIFFGINLKYYFKEYCNLENKDTKPFVTEALNLFSLLIGIQVFCLFARLSFRYLYLLQQDKGKLRSTIYLSMNYCLLLSL